MRFVPLVLLVLFATSLGAVRGDIATETPVASGPGGKARFKPPVVTLDGEPVAVLRFSELPPALAPVWKVLDDGRRVRRFSFLAWLRHLDVDAASLSEAHFHGGRSRVARIAGADLARADVLFSFSQGVRGKLRLEWPPDSGVSDSVDGVRGIALYRRLPVPAWNPEMRRLEVDGEPLDGPPGAAELRGGLRVYLDGRLSGVARRAAVGDAGLGLVPLLGSLGIPLEEVHAADLVYSDDGISRVSRAAMKRLGVKGLRGSGGRLLLAGSDRPMNALLLHRKPAPALHDAPTPPKGTGNPAGWRSGAPPGANSPANLNGTQVALEPGEPTTRSSR